ncbi:hypothetical protein FHL15_007810 [Xylaria flabelliformis]|uniref:AA1-like domain-containing protein n=1 Tax=Xylaria flabelliformis TaxID=2512241 RepID=A0A553HTD1_9PEZI|nr:hypothetical protein FHL15_007810 [Xylaria flabelliformis]
MYANLIAPIAAFATMVAAIPAHELQARDAIYNVYNTSWISNPDQQVYYSAPTFSLKVPDDYLPGAPGFDVWCISWLDLNVARTNCSWNTEQPAGSDVSSTCHDITGNVLVQHTWSGGSSTGSAQTDSITHGFGVNPDDFPLTFKLN